ncbi:MAG: glycosyltransferase [Methylobacteriaceae bacterium]|nr:glycosyltransferase [Methylobacteriaceae bacterium]
MPLTILQVAFPFARVSRDSVGGAEQILAACDAAVMRAGHRSIVVAREGSKVAGDLIPVPGTRRADDPHARAGAHANHREAIDGAISRFGVDVLHFHGLDFDRYLPSEGVPALVTLHLAPFAYSAAALTSERAGTYFNCVSQTQHGSCPEIPNLLAPILNGVDVERLRPNLQGRRVHTLVLARICPEKGVHLAIEAAKKADADLVIAGEVFPYADHERYFAEEIRPRLDARRVFIGPIGFARKRDLLQSARCLLVPSLIAETSSLVAMEAFACGTPVIGFRRGALSEIIDEAVTGVLVDDADEMAAAIARADAFAAAACAETARRRFSAARMGRDYIALYERLGGRSQQRRYSERVAS